MILNKVDRLKEVNLSDIIMSRSLCTLMIITKSTRLFVVSKLTRSHLNSNSYVYSYLLYRSGTNEMIHVLN